MKKFIYILFLAGLALGCSTTENPNPPTLNGSVVSGGPVHEDGNHEGERKLFLNVAVYVKGGRSIKEGEILTFSLDPKGNGLIKVLKIRTPGVE